MRINGNLVGTDNTTPYSFAWNTSSYANAGHTLEARAFDMAGNASTSTVSVTVNNVVTPPPPPQTPTPVAGDVNGDGAATTADLSIILKNYGKRNATRADGDLTGDGRVGSSDLSVILRILGMRRR
jgi:hypothetical protein